MSHLRQSMACLLAVIILLAALPLGAYAAPAGLINAEHRSLPLRNAIALVKHTAGADAAAALDDGSANGILMCSLSEVPDVETFLEQCSARKVIPVLQVSNTDEGAVLVNALSATSFIDVTVVSEDPKVLSSIRNRKTMVRTGLLLPESSETLTPEGAATIREAVRSAPATFCVIPAEKANRAFVSELQELAVAVWVAVPGAAEDASFARRTAVAFTSGANGIVTADPDAVAGLANQWFIENTMTRTPIMIGHRGNPTQAPENSLSGFLTAYENGADVFELDAEITKDGEVIIMHDSTLNRTTDYTGKQTVNQMTLSQIKKYHLLDNNGQVTDEEVPTLREVLETFRDKDCRIFVEFKGNNQDNVTTTAALLQEMDMTDRVDVISFNAKFLTATQKQLGGMSTGLLQSASGPTDNPVAALKVLQSSLMTAQAVQSSVNPNKQAMSDTFMQVATDRGMTIWPWTYAQRTNNNGFLQCPDGLTTDDMQWVKDMLKSLEVEKETVSGTVGKPIQAAVYGVTYGDNRVSPEGQSLSVSLVSGDDCVAIENGILTGTAKGRATVIVGCKTQTTDGSEYVLYTEPFDVTVRLVPVAVWITAGGILLIGAALFFLLRHKHSDK